MAENSPRDRFIIVSIRRTRRDEVRKKEFISPKVFKYGHLTEKRSSWRDVSRATITGKAEGESLWDSERTRA